MNFAARLSNPPSEQVLREAEGVIQAWGLSSGFPKDVVCRLVSCFDSKFLLSLPRPPGFKRKKFSAEQIHRYLWYRQAAKTLGWRDRQKFPSHVENLLKVRVWPDGEAETTDAQCVINHPNKTIGIAADTRDERSGHGAQGRVPKFGAEWGYGGQEQRDIAAPIGPSGEEHSEEHGPGSTCAEKLVCQCGTEHGFESGSCTRSAGSTAITCSSGRAGCCTMPHDTLANTGDRDAGGWTSKRLRVAHPLPANTH